MRRSHRLAQHWLTTRVEPPLRSFVLARRPPQAPPPHPPTSPTSPSGDEADKAGMAATRRRPGRSSGSSATAAPARSSKISWQTSEHCSAQLHCVAPMRLKAIASRTFAALIPLEPKSLRKHTNRRTTEQQAKHTQASTNTHMTFTSTYAHALILTGGQIKRTTGGQIKRTASTPRRRGCSSSERLGSLSTLPLAPPPARGWPPPIEPWDPQTQLRHVALCTLHGRQTRQICFSPKNPPTDATYRFPKEPRQSLWLESLKHSPYHSIPKRQERDDEDNVGTDDLARLRRARPEAQVAVHHKPLSDCLTCERAQMARPPSAASPRASDAQNGGKACSQESATRAEPEHRRILRGSGAIRRPCLPRRRWDFRNPSNRTNVPRKSGMQSDPQAELHGALCGLDAKRADSSQNQCQDWHLHVEEAMHRLESRERRWKSAYDDMVELIRGSADARSPQKRLERAMEQVARVTREADAPLCAHNLTTPQFAVLQTSTESDRQ